MAMEGEGKNAKDYERALAELKKLYNEVRKHDIENVDERIKFIIQNNPRVGNEHISTDVVHAVETGLINRWTESLTEDEKKALMDLIHKAESNRQTGGKDLYIRRKAR